MLGRKDKEGSDDCDGVVLGCKDKEGSDEWRCVLGTTLVLGSEDGIDDGSTLLDGDKLGMSVISKCFAGGVGCGIAVAGFLTNPADVIKVRNQQFTDTKYYSFRTTSTTILREEGIRGFYKGAAAYQYFENAHIRRCGWDCTSQ